MLSVAVAMALLVGAVVYFKFFAPPSARPAKEVFVKIPTGASFEQVMDTLKAYSLIRDEAGFAWLAESLKYKKTPMRSGRYKVNPGWSAVQLIRHLRSGGQAPVKVILNNERLLEEVAAKVARFIEPDSATFMALFQNQNYLDSIGYTQEALMSVFIPNTYEFYWNTSARKFMDKMIKENESFWSKNERLAKAKALGLTPLQAYTLASIVEKETIRNDEKKRIAGVYYNRLKIGMRLQADPTLVFATRDFEARRVTNYHKEFESPYNTYLHNGLPPGPITMASIASIDAALQPEGHEYYYFCARPDGSGFHDFAKTLEAHNENAVRYREEQYENGSE